MPTVRAQALGLLALVPILSAACTKEPSRTTPLSDSGSPASPKMDCDAYASAFNDVLGRTSGACAAAADCKCFPGGVSTKHGCGGITDKATAENLESLAKGFRTAGCPSSIACAAWRCQPVCRGGRCGNE